MLREVRSPHARLNGCFIWLFARQREAPAPSAAEIMPISVVPVSSHSKFYDGNQQECGMCIFASLCAERHIFKTREGCSRLNIAEHVELPGEGCVQSSCPVGVHCVCAAQLQQICLNRHAAATDVQQPRRLPGCTA